MLNLLKDNRGARKKSKALGRGIGSGKGKTSARGGKGQTARTGVALNGFEGGQTPLHRRLPKRGFNSLNKTIYRVVNLGQIQKLIDEGINIEKIDLQFFKDKGFLTGKGSKLKILGKGELKSKIIIEAHAASDSVKKNIEKYDGRVILI